MKDKVLIFFPTPFPYNRPWKGVPLAPLAISRILDKDGYNVKIYAHHLQDDLNKKILDNCHDAICLAISAMTGFQIYDGLKIAKMVKKKYPKLPIIWGGWHPSILPKETLNNPYVDIVMTGQGDQTFPDIVKKIQKGQKIKKRIIACLKPTDLGKVPPLPYHLIDIEKCINNTEYGQRTLPYISSYGCPFRCGFCVEQMVNHRRWTPVPAKNVVKEWTGLVKKYNIDSIAVYDSNFFVNEKRVANICKALIKNKLNIKWGNANGRIRTLCNYSQKTWKLMEQSGCVMILTGAESGSQKALDYIHKDMNVKEIIKFTKLCKKYHIKILYSFLVGLPWSTNPDKNKKFVNQEFNSTFSLIDKLLKISQKNRFTYYLFLPYPGAPLFVRAQKLGLTHPNTLKGWSTYLMSPEDAFNITKGQQWLSLKQSRLTAMLTQYIFGLMDMDSFDLLIKRIPSKLKRVIFKISYMIGLKIVKLRWKYKFFDFPVDYWLFTLVHKYSKLI